MEHALAINGISKQYSRFALQDVSFTVPKGSIVGLIGENGAGKSTVLRCALGLTKTDCGTAAFWGEAQGLTPALKEQIGVVFDGSNFSEELTPARLNRVLRDVYAHWDEPYFLSGLKSMGLPADQKIKVFSKGMKMKLSLLVAFSHHPKLLILDEATSGLDPVMRDDILDLFLDFVQDEENSILVSSHITSDLEKVADYIVFLHQGRVIFNKPKDELLENYGIVKCSAAQLQQLDPQDTLACRRLDHECQALVADRAAAHTKYPKVLVTPATIDEIMLLYIKGETA